MIDRMHKRVVVQRRVANTRLRARRIPRPWIVELETDRSQWDRETTAYEDEAEDFPALVARQHRPAVSL